MAEGEGVGLEATPTYSIAFTAFVFVLISLLVERGIHRLRMYLKKIHQKPLRKVLDKMSEELMLLGFISLLLTVLQSSLVKICVNPDFDNHMLPCSKKEYAEQDGEPSPTAAPEASHAAVGDLGRRLLGVTIDHVVNSWRPYRRKVAEDTFPGEISKDGHCGKQGKVPFLTLEVLHQLHLFIFVLAVTHVIYWTLTVSLALWRLHSWNHWEQETQIKGYDGNEDLEKTYCDKMRCKRKELGLAGHANAFVNRHANHWLYDHEITLWILCFFQQFFSSVSREDYLIFRVGFLNKHNLGESFNFRNFVIRSMEVDFQMIIGIPWWLWLFVVIFLLIDVNGWYSYFWAAFIPTLLVVVIGAKQQWIISKLALQAKNHARQVIADEQKRASNVGKSIKVVDISTAVRPDDKLFWFDNPKILLTLIHFIIFQNSFELAVFFWMLTTFGWNSCTLGNHTLLIVRVVAGILTQILTSWTTIPVYALVTQMGSKLKDTVFTKDVNEGLQKWAKLAKRRASTPTSQEGSVTSVSGHGQDRSDSRHGEGSEHRQDTVPSEAAAQPPPSSTRSVGQSTRNVGNSTRSVGHDSDAAQLMKMCQKLYGKEDGLDIVHAGWSCRERAESRKRELSRRGGVEVSRREEPSISESVDVSRLERMEESKG